MKATRVTALLTAVLAFGACGDSTGLDVEDLEGSWVASVIEYTDNANSANVVDIVQRDGASFTLDVDANGNASTVFSDGLGSTDSDSGTLNSTSTTLTLGGNPINAVRDGDVLTLTDPNDSFDFGSGSSTSATLRIVLSRS
ncbi:MAG: hypothetical protein ABFS14_11470 [Gemmatimonadota bacterium]